MHDFNGQRFLTVQARITLGILERAAHNRDVFEMNNTITHGLNRHVEHVFCRLDDTGYLNRKATLRTLQRTGGNEAIVQADKLDDLRLIQAVTFHGQRIYDDFHELFANADEVDLEYTAQAFKFFLEVFGDRGQRAFGDAACEIENEHRVETRHLDLGDRRLLCVTRDFRFRLVDFFADVLQGLVDIDAGKKFQLNIGATLVGIGGHLLYAFDGSQFLFHRPHQQSFGVFRRNSLECDADVENRYLDIRFRFFRNRHVSGNTADQDNEQ